MGKFFQINKIPLAIIIAGIFIAGSIYLSNSPSDDFLSDSEVVKSAANGVEENNSTESTNQATLARSNSYKVIKVIDGDTVAVEINGKKETIRLIGINTPETVDPRKPVECFGIEASNRAKEILTGKRVKLEADSVVGERGKYGRLLRYVFLDDGTNFNKMMISEGYAYEYTYNLSYKYQSEFRQAEKEAREAKRGLWADGACKSSNVSLAATSAPVVPISINDATAGAECYCASNKYNCSDFQTHQKAQDLYNCCFQKVGADVHRLDRDKDGLACESLP